MTTRQEILLRLACAALQGGMSIDADIPSEEDIELVTGKKDFY